MSTLYKIHVFDYNHFMSELAPMLYKSLEKGDTNQLIAFVTANIALLKEPYEGGRPLGVNWQTELNPMTAQDWGDIALTKYYDPSDCGLVVDWLDMDDLLVSIQSGLNTVILGESFGPEHNYFDPGKMGSYFQSPELTRDNVKVLETVLANNKNYFPKHILEGFIEEIMPKFQEAVSTSAGLYVTF